MKTKVLALLLMIASLSNLNAQKAAQRPAWAAGIYGGFSIGYGAFSQPFKNAGRVTPYPSFAASGWVFQFDVGGTFRNRWGLRAMANGYAASDQRATIESVAKAMFPGYIVDYAPITEFNNKTANHFSVGISYAIPQGRWNFQPEIRMGSTEVYGEWATVQAKKQNSHEVIVWRLRPENFEYRSPTLTIGGRAFWYGGAYWGLFADTYLNTAWYNMEYHIEKTSLIEQSLEQETIRLKKTALGATASVGVFLQIARWEGKKGRSFKEVFY